jgi:hypothetical protein
MILDSCGFVTGARVSIIHRIRKGLHEQLPNKQTTKKHNLQESSLRSGLSIKARMSSTRQAVIFGPNLIGCGNRFDLTPAHQVLLPTGIGPQGAMIFLSRTNPVSGRQNFVIGNFDAATGGLASNPFMVVLSAFWISF